MMTPEQIKAVRAVANMLGEAIKEAGPRGVPSGHLYAVLMGKLSLDQYQQIISGMKRMGWIAESGHLLTWIGKADALAPVGA